MLISDNDLIEWYSSGYLVKEDLLNDVECSHLRLASTLLPSFVDGTCCAFMHPHRVDPSFLTAMCNPKIVNMMEKLLGGKVDAIQSQFLFGVPGTPGFTAHQDNHYIQAKQDVFGSAWLALEDIGPENGGLIVYAGSHQEPVLPVKKVAQKIHLGQDPNANCQEVIVDTEYPQIDVNVKMGSVVFIHGHVIHKSHDNASNRSRNALLMTYIKQGEFFRKGFSAKREIVNVYG